LLVLLFAALRSDDESFLDRHPWVANFFPRRTAALLLVVLLFTAVLLGFAGLYVGTEIFASTKTPLDAIYISVFTLALTDYSPKAGYGQIVVMSEVVNGVLLIVALFPLLISRISTFKNP
jgi:Mn2+/Fe2+ NRAMP family transporter